MSFAGTPSWGNAPLGTTLAWSLDQVQGRSLVCTIDGDGDGNPDETVDPCPAEGGTAHEYPSFGKFEPRLTVQDDLGREVTATAVIYSNHLEFAPEVRFPEQDPAFLSAKLGVDSVVLEFDGKAPPVGPGTILWGVSQGGYLRRIVSASVEGATVTATTAQATLADAVTDGFFGFPDMPIDLASAECLEGCADATAEQVPYDPPIIDAKDGPDEPSTVLAYRLHFGRITILDPYDLSETLATIAESSVEVGLRGSMEFQRVPLRLRLSLGPYAKAEAKLGFFANVPIKSIPLSRWDLGTVLVGPFVFVGSLEPKLEFEAELGAAVKATASVALNLPFEVRYDDEVKSVSVEPELTAQLVPEANAAVQASIELSASVGPKLAFRTLGIVGPYLMPYAALKAQGTVTNGAAELCLEVKAVGGVKAGADLTLLGFIGVTVAEVDVPVFEWVLYDTCWQLPSGCATAPPGLEAWWRAEGNAVDSVGSYSGTPAGAAGFTNGATRQSTTASPTTWWPSETSRGKPFGRSSTVSPPATSRSAPRSPVRSAPPTTEISIPS